MRALAIGLAIAVVVFVVTGGHVFFLPLLFLPLGLFSFGQRRKRAAPDAAGDGASAFQRSRRSRPL
jgi:hypothetical protein